MCAKSSKATNEKLTQHTVKKRQINATQKINRTELETVNHRKKDDEEKNEQQQYTNRLFSIVWSHFVYLIRIKKNKISLFRSTERIKKHIYTAEKNLWTGEICINCHKHSESAFDEIISIVRFSPINIFVCCFCLLQRVRKEANNLMRAKERFCKIVVPLDSVPLMLLFRQLTENSGFFSSFSFMAVFMFWIVYCCAF